LAQKDKEIQHLEEMLTIQKQLNETAKNKL
jgi:hypothetical protein